MTDLEERERVYFMVNRVKVGVIGAGGISYTYLKNMTETFYITEVVGIADIVEERSKKRAEQFHIRQMTVDEIMNDPEIEVVVNLTYPLSHYEITKRALEAGRVYLRQRGAQQRQRDPHQPVGV